MVSTYFQVDTIALNLGILKVCSVDAYVRLPKIH